MTADDANVRLDDHARASRERRYAEAIAYRHRDITPLPAALPVDIWLPEARSVIPVADAELAEQRERANAAIDRARMERAEAEDRETALDERVAELEAALQRSRDAHQGADERLRAVEALADEWVNDFHPAHVFGADLRAALAPATSPAEQEGDRG